MAYVCSAVPMASSTAAATTTSITTTTTQALTPPTSPPNHHHNSPPPLRPLPAAPPPSMFPSHGPPSKSPPPPPSLCTCSPTHTVALTHHRSAAATRAPQARPAADRQKGANLARAQHHPQRLPAISAPIISSSGHCCHMPCTHALAGHVQGEIRFHRAAQAACRRLL